MNCNKCGYHYDDNVNFCPMCGEARVTVVVEDVQPEPQPQQPEEPMYRQPEPQPQQPEEPVYRQPEQPQPTYQQGYQQAPPPQQPQQPVYQPAYQQQPVQQEDQRTRSKATTALVCGILALAIPFGGIALGIVALIMGNAARKEATGGAKGMALAGFIMGIIGLVVWSIFTLVAIVSAVTYSTFGYYSDFFDYYDYYSF